MFLSDCYLIGSYLSGVPGVYRLVADPDKFFLGKIVNMLLPDVTRI